CSTRLKSPFRPSRLSRTPAPSGKVSGAASPNPVSSTATQVALRCPGCPSIRASGTGPACDRNSLPQILGKQGQLQRPPGRPTAAIAEEPTALTPARTGRIVLRPTVTRNVPTVPQYALLETCSKH